MQDVLYTFQNLASSRLETSECNDDGMNKQHGTDIVNMYRLQILYYIPVNRITLLGN